MDKIIAVIYSDRGIYTLRTWGRFYKVFTQVEIAEGLVSSLGEPCFLGDKVEFNDKMFVLRDGQREVLRLSVKKAYEVEEGSGYTLLKGVMILKRGGG